MRTVSTSTQRIIMWIPYINFANLFISLNNISQSKLSFGETIKALACFFVSTVPLGVFYVVLNGLFPALEPLCYIIAMYGIPLSMSYAMVRFQEKYCFSKHG